jgi:hypothetical protein
VLFVKKKEKVTLGKETDKYPTLLGILLCHSYGGWLLIKESRV